VQIVDLAGQPLRLNVVDREAGRQALLAAIAFDVSADRTIGGKIPADYRHVVLLR
jgi:hypothetical protein